MSPLPGAFSDSFEELGDTVKQAGQQMAQLPKDLFETATQQVKGQPVQDKSGQDSGMERTVLGSNQSSQPQLTPEQKLEIKKREADRQSSIRYERILEALKLFRQNKVQETPAYLRGKPGAAENKEEEMEMWKKQEEEKKKKQGPVVLPGQQGGVKGVGERLQGVVG
ncbi:hypothetical protein A2160_05685 [Candidatus Beckwithbacteria bacterium RBG_13_42_9]|uniref:Uncharacterized protein n=1 Tax=Candidatus Beckwithbacteria bacterium RBG_13_42_9 TaxID=1797457 RepID=A0A1F5E669_9BACT|nr:MAG: hypothetical protein A2160_05685 [Candidatus Beckwithbacteria bacterium RBG_13_42_9]